MENFSFFSKSQSFINQVINNKNRKTFKLLITFQLFILSIQTVDISLHPHLFIKRKQLQPNGNFTIKPN